MVEIVDNNDYYITYHSPDSLDSQETVRTETDEIHPLFRLRREDSDDRDSIEDTKDNSVDDTKNEVVYTRTDDLDNILDQRESVKKIESSYETDIIETENVENEISDADSIGEREEPVGCEDVECEEVEEEISEQYEGDGVVEEEKGTGYNYGKKWSYFNGKTSLQNYDTFSRNKLKGPSNDT